MSKANTARHEETGRRRMLMSARVKPFIGWTTPQYCRYGETEAEFVHHDLPPAGFVGVVGHLTIRHVLPVWRWLHLNWQWVHQPKAVGFVVVEPVPTRPAAVPPRLISRQ